jgi:hypothetical protein
MDACSRALRRAMNGVMANLTASMIARASIWPAGGGTNSCFGAGVSELALSLGSLSQVMLRLGGVFFFGHGVGKGSIRRG